jgi:anti-anti-sigma factor
VFETLLDEGEKRIVVNLHKVKWAGSLGIGMLIDVFVIVTNAGGEMVLTHVPGRVKSLPISPPLNRVFKIFDNDDEAVRYLTGSEEKGHQIQPNRRKETL